MAAETFNVHLLAAPKGVADPNVHQRTALGGVEYELWWRWNARVGAWYLTVSDSEGKVLIAGRRVNVNLDILGRSRNDADPPGMIWVLDTAEVPKEPGFRDLNTRVVLVYLAPQD